MTELQLIDLSLHHLDSQADTDHMLLTDPLRFVITQEVLQIYRTRQDLEEFQELLPLLCRLALSQLRHS